ncbi:unnamed protein product [Kuraishia capsulata CBS 1993]|uniref:Cation efflux protein transmembrane domain-containing protein n=1 Tax=Kuraishia capsulata CBS 1993 TaxID=1382522 RepID=W6MKZ3_9ASCO|nr:uncharacterized protein KUCA_T00003068001 [Kuraishia capsulata CBS 1993]CDK27091.1 unnamed protein product [Kuraishia capsulata CBS 1993]
MQAVDLIDEASTPLVQPGMQRRASMFNPNTPGYLTTARPTRFGITAIGASSVDVSAFQERLEYLHDKRVKSLLGDIGPLTDWMKFYKSPDILKSIPKKDIRKFYEHQNGLIERYADIDELLGSKLPISLLKSYGSDLGIDGNLQDHRAGVPADIEELIAAGGESEKDSIVKFTIVLILIINVGLLGGKGLVVYLTFSMSLIASLVDSVLDLLSSAIIYYANSFSTKGKSAFFPVGTARLEPLGILIFSIIMVTSFLQVAQDSLKLLIFDKKHEVVQITFPTLAIMILTIAIKLICYYACISVNNSSIQALAEDSKTDIVFNTFSIIFPLIGHWLELWWLDPLGALMLCIFVVFQWSAVAFEHISNLTGSAASTEQRQQILYCCMRFATSIQKITALQTYHVGDNINVEVDLVMNLDLNMRDCHDIGETLQYAIETLPGVERCFVHIDYREGNFQGHLT